MDFTRSQAIQYVPSLVATDDVLLEGRFLPQDTTSDITGRDPLPSHVTTSVCSWLCYDVQLSELEVIVGYLP